jgi:hypothetical protein
MCRFTLGLLIFVLGQATWAAEKPEPLVPAVELRVRAAADMLDVFDYLGKLVPNDEQFQKYLNMAKVFGESKNGLFGIDPKKPIGAYVGIANEVADSPVVLMVPVSVEADFLSLLKTFLKLDPKKLEGDLYSFVIPNIPAGPGYFRFAHGYAYVTIRSAKSIDLERLIQPKDFFAEKHPDILNAKVRIDRFPADIRKSILGQLELGWHETLAELKGTPLEQAARKCLVDVGAEMLKTILEEGQSLDFAVKITPSSDDIAANLTLTPKAGTGLAKFLKEQGTRPSQAASMFAESSPNTMMTSAFSISLPPEARKKVADLVGLMVEAQITEQKWEGDDKDDGKELQKIARSIVQTGDLQMSSRMGFDPETKKLEMGLAFAVTDGDAIEKLLRRFVGRHELKRLQLDVHKPDAYHYHAITPPDAAPADKPFVLATGEKLWALGSSVSDLQEALKRKPKPAPFYVQEMFYGTPGAFAPPALSEKHFGKPMPRGADRIFIVINGGDTLMIDVAVKGKVIAYARDAGFEKKK